VETVDFSHIDSNYHFLHLANGQTQAAADLTHAFLNPQPAGPFCQVGDEHAIALRRLADIMGAAKLKRGKDKLPPPKMKLRIMHLRG
jgi:hypothetical protein